MTGLLDLLTIIYDPPAVFARVREKPRFLVPFLGLAVLQLVIAALSLPYTRAAMQAMAATRGGGADPSKFAVVGVVFAPLGLAVGVLLSAGILWVLVSLMGVEASFRHLLSISTYVGMTAILYGAAAVAVLKLSHARVTTMADMRPALGLDLLVPDASRFVQALLGSVNPFTLWALGLTGLGIAVTHKTSHATAYTVAAIALVLNASIAAGFAMLGGGG